MAIFKVALSLLKKQKAYGVTIFCLSLVVSLMLSTVLTVMHRSGRIQDAAFRGANSPDVMFTFPMWQYDPELSAFLEDKEEVKHVSERFAFVPERREVLLNGIECHEWLLFFPYKPEENAFKIKDAANERFTLNEGEVTFPLLYENKYSLSVGGTVSINGHTFTITGFFEDPIHGSPMVGTRRAYISEPDFDKYYAMDINHYQSVHFYVYVNADSSDADYPAQIRTAIEGVNLGSNGYIMTGSELKQYSTMVSDLVSVILLACALLALIITLYILRYAVLSSIEGSFVTLGVYKAVGFTGGQIRLAVILQYAAVCLLGSVIGIIACLPVIPIVGGIMMDSAGLIWVGGLWVPAGVLVAVSAVALICAVTWLNTQKIKRISPVRAIAFGRAPVYFAKRLNIPLKRLSWLPLHLRMAFKQMMTRRKQYVVLIIISMLLTYMTAFIGSAAALFDSDKNVLRVFGFPPYDVKISIASYTAERHDELIGKLDAVIYDVIEKYGVVTVYEESSVNMTIEKTWTAALIYDTFDGIGLVDPISGRFPRYDNELALSPVMAERFGKGVGDTVYITDYDGNDVPYIVTGIVQCSQEVGQNFSVTLAGVRRISPEFITLSRCVIFNGEMDAETAAAEIKAAHQDDDISLSTEAHYGLSQMIESIRSVINPATTATYALTVILILLITLLLAVINIYRENTDFGIFKSTGFTSRQLRFQFAIRFLLVSLTGGLMGILLNLAASNMLISAMFSLFGIPRVRMDFGVPDLLLPVALVCVIALIAAWLVSGRIKRVSGRNLILE